MKEKELVIVTGAGSGIGRAIAEIFSENGFPLLLLDRSGKASQLKLPLSLSAQVDVTDLKSFKLAVEKAEQQFGPAGCIVNNAGVMLLGQLDTQDPEEWKKMLDINVIGVLNGIKTVISGMIERRSGTIVNISSIAGRKTFSNHAAYCATKFAVHALTENLREEVAKHGVRCITIAPGVVETNLLSHTSSNEIKSAYGDWKKQIGGGLEPRDIAEVVYFAYTRPQRLTMRELLIAPTHQEQ